MAVPTVDDLCQQARQAIAQREWNLAREAYENALRLKSNSADIHQGMATVCFQLRDLRAAAFHFKEVTRLDPHRAGAFINLGAIYNLLDQLDDAVNSLRKGIQLDPQRTEGYYNLGLAYRRKGQIDLAIHAYREALRLNPRLADAQYNLGNVYLEKELYAQAVEAYQQALQIRPGWDKAEQGLEAADAALEEQNSRRGDSSADVGIKQEAAVARKIDPALTLNPEVHDHDLTSLHKATVDAEGHGKRLHDLTIADLEPAIKELSSALINPEISITSLDHSIQRFEEAIKGIRSAKDDLQFSVEKLRMLGDQLVAEG